MLIAAGERVGRYRACWQDRSATPSPCGGASPPYLRDQPVVVYAVVAPLFLLWLAFMPGLANLGQVLVILGLGVLLWWASKRCGGRRRESSRLVQAFVTWGRGNRFALP